MMTYNLYIYCSDIDDSDGALKEKGVWKAHMRFGYFNSHIQPNLNCGPPVVGFSVLLLYAFLYSLASLCAAASAAHTNSMS